jgi:ribosome-binding factor A
MKGRGEGGGGPSQRQLRVGELIRRTLAEVLARGDVHEPGLASASITVSEVRMTPDLRHATVYVMPLGGRKLDQTLAALTRAKGELRHAVDRVAGLKYSPDLSFRADDTYDRIDETRRLFQQPEVKRDL